MSYQPDVPSRSDNTWLSLGAAAGAPWKIAVASGAVVGLADLGLELLGGRLAPAGPISVGLTVLFLVAGIGAYLRGGRIQDWARRHPWQVAAVPGIGTAATLFPVQWLLTDAGFFSAALSAGLRGAGVLLIVGLVGMVVGAMRRP
jgi:hypothetical protein